MTMPPRILLFSAIGIILYLSLSLYHGHRLKNFPDPAQGNGKTLSAKAQEKNWVQVTTAGRATDGTNRSPSMEGQGNEAPAGSVPGNSASPERSTADPDKEAGAVATAASDDLRERLAAMQEDLLQTRELLLTREDELREARRQRDRALAEKQLTDDRSSGLPGQPSSTRREQEDQRMETDRLQTELKEARTRAAIAEGELQRARLKAEAMFRYGQEQNRLLASARQEVESLERQLREAASRLRQTQRPIPALQNRVPQPGQEKNAPDTIPASSAEQAD